jgi:hypothetical protein
MELLIILAVLCALGPLAMRFGYDSGNRLRSHEEDAAACGMRWGTLD